MKSTGDLTQAGPVKQTEYQSAVGSQSHVLSYKHQTRYSFCSKQSSKV